MESEKKATNNKTKKSTTKKQNTNSKTTKKNTTKNSGVKKTTKKNSNVKKTTPKKTDTPKVETVKEINKVEEKLEKTIIFEAPIKDITSEQEKIEKEIRDEIKEVRVAKLEDAKYKTGKKDKTLIAIGVILSILGLIALLISLAANRIIDKEFMSDSVVTVMLATSLVIEGFGAFIIVSET